MRLFSVLSKKRNANNSNVAKYLFLEVYARPIFLASQLQF